LLLVRHAEPERGRDETSGLSTAGHADAACLADRLANEPIDAVYSSPARRARETALPLATRLGLSIHEVADLRERELGTERFADFTAAVRATWDDFAFAHPGGESNAAAMRRIVAAHATLLASHPEGRIVLVTHGNVLALLLPPSQAGFCAVLSDDLTFALTSP
jgi:2,3-bisphosphoglycerate-dependent phosphoglycerate mutase